MVCRSWHTVFAARDHACLSWVLGDQIAQIFDCARRNLLIWFKHRSMLLAFYKLQKFHFELVACLLRCQITSLENFTEVFLVSARCNFPKAARRKLVLMLKLGTRATIICELLLCLLQLLGRANSSKQVQFRARGSSSCFATRGRLSLDFRGFAE